LAANNLSLHWPFRSVGAPPAVAAVTSRQRATCDTLCGRQEVPAIRKSVTRWTSAAFILPVLLVSAIVCKSAQPPLGKVQVLGLIAIGAPGDELASLVQRDGIDFVASPQFLTLLKQSGAATDPKWEKLVQALASARVGAQAAPTLADEEAVLAHLSRGASFQLESAGSEANYAEAEREFRAALGVDPANPVLHLALARSLACESQFGAAVAEARGAVNALPGLAMAHIILATALTGNGDTDGSMAELRKAVELDPDPAFARNVLARALMNNHDTAGAAGVLRQGIAAHPGNPSLHDSLGTVLFEEGNLDDAITEFHRALALGSADPELRIDLAAALRRKGDLNGSIAQTCDAIRLDPNNHQYHYMLAEALIDNRQLQEAMTELNEAIRLRPDFAPAYSERGYVLVMQHHVDEAIQQYRKAIQLDPKLASAHANLGTAYWRKHDNEEGYKEVLIAHELAPNDPGITTQFDKLPEKWKRKATQPSGIVKPSSAPMGEPPKPDFMYYADQQGNSLTPLEAEMPTLGGKAGPFRTTVYSSVIGERSPVRFKAGSKWDFLIRSEGKTQKLNFRLERFESKGGSRTVNLGKKVKITSNPEKQGLLNFNSTPYGNSSIELTIPYDLVPGEYGFFVSASSGGFAMFCFGVDGP
jgi:Flp pilus assembly protein TadD